MPKKQPHGLWRKPYSLKSSDSNKENKTSRVNEARPAGFNFLNNLLKRRGILLALVTILLLTSVMTLALSVLPARASHHQIEQSSFYGANNVAVQAAVNAAQWLSEGMDTREFIFRLSNSPAIRYTASQALSKQMGQATGSDKLPPK